jgi:hypothetical protein
MGMRASTDLALLLTLLWAPVGFPARRVLSPSMTLELCGDSPRCGDVAKGASARPAGDDRASTGSPESVSAGRQLPASSVVLLDRDCGFNISDTETCLNRKFLLLSQSWLRRAQAEHRGSISSHFRFLLTQVVHPDRVRRIGGASMATESTGNGRLYGGPGMSNRGIRGARVLTIMGTLVGPRSFSMAITSWTKFNDIPGLMLTPKRSPGSGAVRLMLASVARSSFRN